MKTTLIGFDSAWADNPAAPGAICSVVYDGEEFSNFIPPHLAGFAKAQEFIASIHRDEGLTIIAIDQPTIVHNQKGMRVAEKVAGAIVGFIGGGVQPANRSKEKMFGERAPLWEFLRDLGAKENPEESRQAFSGKFIMEVFPALALPSFNGNFYGRNLGPKYNPVNRRKFSRTDWEAVIDTVSNQAKWHKFSQLIEWCSRMISIEHPKKCHQDELDAAICLMVAVHWKLTERSQSVMIGDLHQGYIVSPATEAVKKRLVTKAKVERCALDGVIL